MSTLLAFDWDEREIRWVVGTLKGKQLHVDAAEATPLDQGVDSTDGKSVGEMLRRELSARNVKPVAVVGCVSRQDVVLHSISLPAVSADEIAKMVDFQATVDFALPDEASTYDYLLDDDPETGVQRALVAVVPRTRIDRIRQAADALGVKLSAIRMQSTARAAARRQWGSDQDSSSQEAEVLLAAGMGSIEAIAMRQGQVLLSQLTPLPHASSDEAQGIQRALRRLRAQLGTEKPPLNSKGVSVLAPADATWIAALDSQENGTVAVCDPLQHLANVPEHVWGRMATLVGALVEEIDAPKRSLDFLKPRRPAAPHPLRRYRAAIAASVALIVLAGFGLRLARDLQALSREVDHWIAQNRTVSRELKELDPYRDQSYAVADWLDSRVHWLEAYQELLTVLPDSSQLYLTQISFAETGSFAAPGAIHLEGYAASRETVASLAILLAEDGRYRLRPIALHAAGGNGNYPQRFEAELTLLAGWDSDLEKEEEPPTADEESAAEVVLR